MSKNKGKEGNENPPFGHNYIYVTRSPVSISSLNLEYHRDDSFLRSTYVLCEEIHEFLRKYAKGIVNVEIPGLQREIHTLDKQRAAQIGKAILTHEAGQNSALEQKILDVTGLTVGQAREKHIWNLRALFLEGDGIEIQGWITRNPTIGWGFVSDELLEPARTAATESFDPEFSRI